MSYSINWTTEATDTFLLNIAYLEKEWDHKVLNRFLDRVEKVIQNIADDPFLYSVHQNLPDTRKCVINKRIVLFYRIFNDNSVDLVTFWNTYQDPANLKL